MNDRQRLEAIVAVVRKYLPPDGISREDAMREIIGLVDPLPEQEPVAWHHPDCAGVCLACLIELKVHEEYGQQGLDYLRKRVQTPRKEWVGLTDDEIHKIINDCTPDQAEQEELNDFARAVRFVEAKLREKNT